MLSAVEDPAPGLVDNRSQLSAVDPPTDGVVTYRELICGL